MTVGRIVSHPLARVEEGHRQSVEAFLRVLVEQPHRLAGVEYRTAADGDQQIGLHPLHERDTAADGRLVGLGCHFAEHLHVLGAQLATQRLDHAALLGQCVGYHHDGLAVELAQIVQCPFVEVGVGRHAEPLRRRAPPRNRLDVEQLAIVDVLGGA